MRHTKVIASFIALLAFALCAVAKDSAPATKAGPFIQQKDQVYGEVYGTGLLMDVFTPTGKRNGLAIIDVVSGLWYSGRGKIRDHERAQIYNILCSRGYVVFAVRPGSRPKYTGLEMVAHVKTAIRFVRAHAKDYGIDPNRIGLTGASSGGHLASLAAVTSDPGNPDSNDPIQRVSCRVKAVAVFFPPTDFLDWNGTPVPMDRFQDLFFGDRASHSEAESEARAEELSPALQVKGTPPPFLLFHGDADTKVPLQQSKLLVQALRKAGGSAKLIVKVGGGHAWPGISHEVKIMADWFDKQLRK